MIISSYCVDLFAPLHTFNTNVHANVLRDKIVAAPSAAGVDELLARLGGCVVVIARKGG